MWILEVVTEEVKGLKIPLSSVASKGFYRVPAEYLTTGGDGNDSGFNKVYSDQEPRSCSFLQRFIIQMKNPVISIWEKGKESMQETI